MRTRFACLAAALVWLAGYAGPLAAQTTVTVGGRLHTQFNTTSVAGEPESEFVIRRARVDASIKVNDFLSGFVQPEYGGDHAFLRVAYARLDFGPALYAMIGQYKRPFDLFTLTSSLDILAIERTGDIRGVDTCAGVGGLCSYGRFMEQLALSPPDIGVILGGGDRGKRITYAVSVMNGTGSNVPDENSAKSFSGRLVLSPAPDVHLAANVAAHDYVSAATGTTEYASAFGGDLEIGNFHRGLHLQAGFVAGDNWLNPVAGAPTRFVTAQAIVTYKFPLPPSPYAEAIEPLVRVSVGNPSTATPQDGGVLLTPGLVWYVTGRNKLAANVDIWNPQQGSVDWGLKVQSYLFF